MGKDGHQAAPSILALLTVFLSFQGASFLWAGLGVALHWSALAELDGGLAGCFLLGAGLSLGVALGLIGAVCSPRLLPFVGRRLVGLVSRLSPARAERLDAWGQAQWASLRRCLTAFRASPRVPVGMLAVAVGQLGAYYSIPFFVRLALGEPWVSPLTVLSLQAVLALSVSSLPLPGAVGISESAFLALYGGMVSPDLLPAAALLSRGISFYLPVMLSGGFLFLHRVFSTRRTEKILPYRERALDTRQKVS
jgi:hypothetical protein